MRFACQSCGKAYNLPEEKIADKSNVKLKCRVCGAIVEVKKQGEVVATILGEGDTKRGRVSEAPAPLTSMTADDGDDATHAIAVSDQILSEAGSSEDAAAALMGHVKSALSQRSGLGPLPPPPPTGFGSPPPAPAFGSPPPPAPAFGSPPPPPAPAYVAPPPPTYSPTPVPPPLSAPEPARAESPFSSGPSPFSPGAPPLPSSLGLPAPGPGSPPPPLPNAGAEPLHVPAFGAPLQNGSNGAQHFGEAIPLPDEPPPAPLASAGGLPVASADGGYAAPGPLDMPPPQSALADDTTKKMLAALATGILIGFIIARLFF